MTLSSAVAVTPGARSSGWRAVWRGALVAGLAVMLGCVLALATARGAAASDISFTYAPDIPDVGQPVSFTATGPAGDHWSYDWDFGDGTTGTGPSPTHAYTSGGDKTVVLSVTSDRTDKAAVTTQSLHVNLPPTATFTSVAVGALPGQDPSVPLVGQEVAFDAGASTDADGAIETFEWDLGTGAFGAPQTTPGLVASFAQRGQRTVRLRVTDNRGASSVRTVDLRVNAPPTIAVEATPAAPIDDDVVTLKASTFDPDGASDIAAIVWDLDADGEFDDAASPEALAVFVDVGSYPVAARVIDGGGATATATRTVTVRARTASDLPAPPLPASALPVAPGGAGSQPTTAEPSRSLTVLRGVRVAIAGTANLSYTEISRFTVFAPAGSRVKVACEGRGCPKRAVRRTVGVRRSVRVTALLRRLGRGAVIRVVITKSGFIGKVVRLRMRSGAPPQRLERCLPPGAVRPTRC